MTTALSIVDDLINQMDCDGQETKTNENIPSTKHFYKNYSRLVFDAIDGELYSNPNISRLYTNDSSIKVVYRNDWDKSKVALISGGGSGHEPCFFGFVGKGMLTAAVCGEIFASPTTKAIIYAILTVASKEKGVLLIITNYTGDVFNFTLASEICINKYNIPCKIISLCDDISLPRSNIPNIGRRGLAGGVFIHKIAGYYSEIGCDLNEIHLKCTKYAQYIGTVGIAASVCHLIGTKSNKEMIVNELELGYGVHGEPGFEKIKFDNIENIIPKMIKIFKLCIENGCKSIIKNKNILNELDNICGDGDCGTTLEFGAKLLLKNINKFNYKSMKFTFQKIGYILSDMGGTSGALYGYLFICLSNEISKINNNNNVMDSINICNVFKNGILELSKYSKAKINDRTMLDSLIPAINKIIEIYLKDKNDHKNAIKQCSIAANNGCLKTQNMIAKFGRTSYLSNKIQQKCVDPGAKAVAILIDSFVNVICNNL